MTTSKTYPNIDMIRTGALIKKYILQSGMTVKDIQTYLHLSCPQPIYRWIKGKILPSVDHLLMLSELFNVHMEDLLIKKHAICTSPKALIWGKFVDRERMIQYAERLILNTDRVTFFGHLL